MRWGRGYSLREEDDDEPEVGRSPINCASLARGMKSKRGICGAFGDDVRRRTARFSLGGDSGLLRRCGVPDIVILVTYIFLESILSYFIF